MGDMATWAPLLLTAGVLFVLFQVLGRQSKIARALASTVCIGLTLRYLYWRVLFSLPSQQHLLQRIWSRGFLLVEMASAASSMLVYFFMSRHIDRSSTADERQHSPLLDAPADVFIATFNEERDILERTIVGAKAIEHSDLRVWVLDDGARPWVRELAEGLGAMYACRVKGKHAKAGNVNNGMQCALHTGRRPEFVLLLDADFIPHRKILKRTLGLFEDTDVGIVQTPQHFFNHDPVQSNLLCSAVWPDEQRFFFNVLLPSKDAWGAAFCCGTSAIFRVDAFMACGGMATETVTEDMLTTFKMEEYGYRTIFLNERLSLGLAPESLMEFISQRSRWCLGAIQQIFTRWSFAGPGRMSLINRVAFFDTVLYWVSSAAFKLMLLSCPMVYWFTGTSVIRASLPDLVLWMAPPLMANLLFMYFLTGNRVLPVMTDITQLLTAFVICRTVATGLLRPFGRAFKVTAKGVSTTGVTVHWDLLWRFAALSALTLGGMLLHISRFNPGHGMQGYGLNIFWSLVNAAVLALAAAACVELPKRRRDDRFNTREEALVRIQGGADGVVTLACTLTDISLGGANLLREQGWDALGGPAVLVLDHGKLALPFYLVRQMDRTLALSFFPDDSIRHALIVKLFTGDYHREVDEISTREVFETLARALLS